MGTCFFIGHREASDQLFPYIRESAERLIQECLVRDFYVGGYGNFDRFASEAIIQLKKAYPCIRLFRVLAYHPAEQLIELQSGFDGTYYPEGMEYVPRRYAISRVNRVLINQSDFLIAYVWHTASNAKKLLEYAKKREQKGLIRIINLYGETLLQ